MYLIMTAFVISLLCIYDIPKTCFPWELDQSSENHPLARESSLTSFKHPKKDALRGSYVIRKLSTLPAVSPPQSISPMKLPAASLSSGSTQCTGPIMQIEPT